MKTMSIKVFSIALVVLALLGNPHAYTFEHPYQLIHSTAVSLVLLLSILSTGKSRVHPRLSYRPFQEKHERGGTLHEGILRKGISHAAN